MQEDDREPVTEANIQPSLIDSTKGIARPIVPLNISDWDVMEQLIKEDVAQRLYKGSNNKAGRQ